MTILFHPNDTAAREALERFCFTHPLTLQFKQSANPLDRMGNKLYEMVSTLEIARPHLYEGEFIDSLTDQFQRYVEVEKFVTNDKSMSQLTIQKMTVYAAMKQGEPELNSITDEVAYIIHRALPPDDDEGFFYSVDELKSYMLGTAQENQNASNFPYPGNHSQYYFKIPRGIYDALLCICANKLKSENPKAPEFVPLGN